MANPPLVSIIIPHLNEPDLPACLHSLARQAGRGITFEIIVVDNGSRDLPRAAVSAVPQARLVVQPIPGPGPARNLGVAEAAGEILAFIDADCVAAPNWLAAIVAWFQHHPETDIVGGDIRIRPTDPDQLTAIEAYENIFSYRAREYVERHGFAATGNMAVRAKIFPKVGLFGGIGTMEDTEWGQRATAMGHGIAFVGDARVYTPSCKCFSELARRWDRHVAHEFKAASGTQGRIKWLARSAMIAASPALEVVRIWRSDRAGSLRERVLALRCVTQVRLYRAGRMLRLIWNDNAASMVNMWNR
ncbi:glycosyltransferase [Devosia sp. 1566]|uniref:glycosyltransferase n=1 Tax=Devosia sp. 1566 TaxID=2499144 RepID=UPI000FDB2C4B|nr:glycosyltransferase [Devosia sp. 1566]